MNGIELLRRDWSENDKGVITRLLENINANKFFISKTLYTDIEAAIQLCIRLKDTIDGPPPPDTVPLITECEIEEDSSSSVSKRKLFGITF